MGLAEPRRTSTGWWPPGNAPAGRPNRPYFGRNATELPLYFPSTLSLKTNLRTRPVGERPLVKLEPTDHPLAAEQRTGITRDRVREIAETLLHQG